MKTIHQRFWEKVDKSGECWIWTGANDGQNGYGKFSMGSRPRIAHRISYELAIGPIPAGMFLDHICHVPACVRPSHLRPVTNKQNGENLGGLTRANTSGVRGVRWDKRKRKWSVRAQHNQREHFGGYFNSIEEAEAAAIALRNKLFTHNDLDRMAS